MKNPIFLFSMPRSGSTLLQRVLSSHELIGTSPEPWILLPLVYALRDKGSLSEYSNVNSSKAIKDVLNTISNGEEVYNDCIREFTSKVYTASLKEGELFFLDKTPRYYLIIDEIYQIFPNAKFIFLFRNPIHIYSSILQTWCNNRFLKLYGSHNDLTIGFNKLGESYDKYREHKNTIGIRYEDFVLNPSKSIDSLLDFLNIEKDKEIEHRFVDIDLKSSGKEDFLGDPTGIYQYKTISKDSLIKWKDTFNTRTRKKILKKYINKTLTSSSLSCQGYNKEEILKEIESLDNKGKYNPLTDIIHYTSYKIISKYNLYLFFGKKMSWIKNKFLS